MLYLPLELIADWRLGVKARILSKNVTLFSFFFSYFLSESELEELLDELDLDEGFSTWMAGFKVLALDLRTGLVFSI